MAALSLDTGTLVKRYHHEVGSEVINELLQAGHNRAFISQLARVELVSAFAI